MHAVVTAWKVLVLGSLTMLNQMKFDVASDGMGQMIIAVYREEVVVACVEVLSWYSPARNKSLHDKLQSANIAPVDITYTTKRYRRVEEAAVQPRRMWEV
jgi:hypothetical protein